MSKRIDRVGVREKLAYRRDPYWLRLTAGHYVGYRRMTPGKPGSWLARAYTDSGYKYETLGDFADRPDEERYDRAKLAAENWFKHLDMGGSTEPTSVKAACEAYLEKLKNEKGEQAKKDTEGYFRRLVYGDPERKIPADPIARVLLSKLSKAHMADWRARALEHNGDRSSFNRNITPLRAALNLAHEQGKVASDQAWLTALRPFSDKELEAQCERRCKGTLDRDARRQLVEKASEEARPLFKALALLPMRPGEIAALRVEHLNVRERLLEIPAGKVKGRIIPLPAEAFAHFKACAKGKHPSAWLIARADASQWKKEAWRDEIKAAAKKAKLPKATVAYTLRHSVITELVTGGLDIFTIAKLASTSVKMIEKHYGHLQQEHARSALEKLALA
jgi:integrase